MTPRRPTPAQEEARAAVLARLATYRTRRAALHADVLRASELGLTQAEIAEASGLTRQWVAKILARP